MPKGQYTRKPRALPSEPAPDIAPVLTEARVDAVRADYVVGGDIASEAYPEPVARPALSGTEPNASRDTGLSEAGSADLAGAGEHHMAARGDTALPHAPVPLRAPASEVSADLGSQRPDTFDAWAAEEPAIVPANDRVTQMVREWGGVVTVGEHNVTWLPSPDGSKIVVTLITPHGTSEMTGDAGAWTEGDIASALAGMRQKLMV